MNLDNCANDFTSPPAASSPNGTLTPDRRFRRLLPALAFLAVGCIYLFFSPNFQWSPTLQTVPYGADFLQEWTGGHMIWNGQINSVYSDEFLAVQHDRTITGFEWDPEQFFPPVYPPPHYLLFSPWGAIPYRIAVLGWLALLLGAACLSSILLQSMGGQASGGRGYLWISVLLFPPLLLSITLGQKSALWLLLFVVVCRWIKQDRWFAAGLLAGLITIKPTLCFLLPLLMILDRRWRFLGGMALSTAVLWGAAICIFPQEAWGGFLAIASTAGRYTDQHGFHLDWSCNLISLASSLPIGWSAWGKMAISLPLALYALLAAVEVRSSWNDPKRWMTWMLATILLSPHFYHYDLCILLLPIVWMLATETQRGICYFVTLSLALMLAPEVYALWQIPLLPIVLLGMLCELRLSPRLSSHTSSIFIAPRSVLPDRR
ncbi:glycosyltransferase family 87 protein [Pirellulaceae bacterium SH467]